MIRWLLILGLSCMDATWVYPWAVALGTWSGAPDGRSLASPVTALALVFLGAAATHGVVRRSARRRRGQVALAFMGLTCVVIAVLLDQLPSAGILEALGALVTALAVVLGQPRALALAFGLGLFLWWRGVRIGAQTATTSDVEGAFRWGLGCLVGFGLLTSLALRPSQLPALYAQALPAAVGFFFASLVTLSLARLEGLRTLRLNGQWLALLVVLAGGVVLLALVIAQVFAFDALLVATQPLFYLLGQLILLLIYVIVIPLAYVVQLLVYLLLRLFQPGSNPTPPEPLGTNALQDLLGRLFSQAVPPEILAAAKALVTVALLGVVLIFVARAAARWRPTSAEADAAEEERERVGPAGGLLAWLRALLRRRRKAPMVPVGAHSELTSDAAGVRLSSVRGLYRELLRVGEVAGASRAPASTPYEHAPALEQALGHAHEQVDALTQAYVGVRYGERDVDAVALEELERALRAISEAEAEVEDPG